MALNHQPCNGACHVNINPWQQCDVNVNIVTNIDTLSQDNFKHIYNPNFTFKYSCNNHTFYTLHHFVICQYNFKQQKLISKMWSAIFAGSKLTEIMRKSPVN